MARANSSSGHCLSFFHWGLANAGLLLNICFSTNATPSRIRPRAGAAPAASFGFPGNGRTLGSGLQGQGFANLSGVGRGACAFALGLTRPLCSGGSVTSAMRRGLAQPTSPEGMSCGSPAWPAKGSQTVIGKPRRSANTALQGSKVRFSKRLLSVVQVQLSEAARTVSRRPMQSARCA